MPKITHLTDKRITITRLQNIGGDKQAMMTVTSDFAHIQPEGFNKTQIDDGVFGKRFRAYVDGAVDVEAGDHIRDTDGNRYAVVAGGVSRRDFGTFDHKIIILEQTT